MPKKSDITAKERQDQKQFIFRNRVLDVIHHFIANIKWIVWAWVGYWAYKSVKVLAGKDTFTNIAISVVAKFASGNFAAILLLLLAAALVWGFLERRLRHRAIASMHDVREKYESTHDPNRSSSHLTQEGASRPED